MAIAELATIGQINLMTGYANSIGGSILDAQQMRAVRLTHRHRIQPVMAAAVPNLSEPAQVAWSRAYGIAGASANDMAMDWIAVPWSISLQNAS